MIERFNFYDVFGFFIPGSLVLLTMWLPFGLIDRRGPSGELTSAVIAIIIAYIVGHFLQAWATRAYPSTKAGRTRSSVMLDEDDEILGDQLRHQFAALAREELGIDVANPLDPPDVADRKRDAAFLLARESLILNKSVGYAEQFQGLYTMMRGNMVALAIGACYLFGWIVSAPAVGELTRVLLIVVAAGAVIAIGHDPDVESLKGPARRVQEQRHALVVSRFLYVTVFLTGAAFGAATSITPIHRLMMLGAFVCLVALGLQSSRSYDIYADEFAKAVYRGFIRFSSNSKRQDPFD